MLTKSIQVHHHPEERRSEVATAFIRKANEFACVLTVSDKDHTVNAKSLMGVLSIGLGNGAEYTLQADGSDEEAALAALTAILEG